jgi:hypothetical protein
LVQDRTQVPLLAFEFRRLAQALRLAASISPFNHSLKSPRTVVVDGNRLLCNAYADGYI